MPRDMVTESTNGRTLRSGMTKAAPRCQARNGFPKRHPRLV